MAKRKKKELSRSEIIEEFLLNFDRNANPETVSEFCEHINISEENFYIHYDNLKSVESSCWEFFLDETLTVLATDESYAEFGIREKLLAFYFTHIEVLQIYRPFILSQKQSWVEYHTGSMKSYKKSFLSYIKNLVSEGIESGEIAKRKPITELYGEGFWLQLLFVVRFWTNDDSPDFDKTDAAIEKAVNLSFELIAPGPMEAFFDFAKFLIQNR